MYSSLHPIRESRDTFVPSSKNNSTMSKQLRAVRTEDLVVGKEYYSEQVVDMYNEVLRFVGVNERGSLAFDHVSGPEVYMRDNEGHVVFFSGRKFYEQIEG